MRSAYNTFNLENSVEQKLDFPLFLEKGVEVFIKRDDLIHPIVSGNKWRKLKYNIIKAQTENKNHLVTFGGAYSNHLLATACAGAVLGLKTTGFVRGEEEVEDNHYLFLSRLYGMNIIRVTRADYKDKHTLYNQYFATDPSAYFVDEGGSGTEGEMGCSELVTELQSKYDCLLLAIGTGATIGGIANGLKLNSMSSKLIGIDVLKGIERPELTNSGIELFSDYHFGGYGKYSNELLEFIKYFVSNTGILIDQVYTAKMFFGLFDLIKKDYFGRGSQILAIHTGGNLGILSLVQ